MAGDNVDLSHPPHTKHTHTHTHTLSTHTKHTHTKHTHTLVIRYGIVKMSSIKHREEEIAFLIADSKGGGVGRR